MPGRGGIGAGHQRTMYFLQDPTLNYLTQTIGEDAKQYERYYSHSSNTQHRLFGQRGI
jgi:hypothetical protein